MNIAADRRQLPVRPSEIEFAGEAALCDPRGALYLPGARLLVVSDLHLEKGSSFARRGMLLPPYDSGETLARLGQLVADHRPAMVLSLGDSFHDGKGAERLSACDRAALLALMRGRDWLWVTGNHDPQGPGCLPGATVAEAAIGRLAFRHEPSPDEVEGEISGHLHPGAIIVRRGRAVRRRCFAGDGTRLIMPAFGAYTGMLNVLDQAFRGLFRPDRLVAHMLGSDRVYAIPGRSLRRA